MFTHTLPTSPHAPPVCVHVCHFVFAFLLGSRREAYAITFSVHSFIRSFLHSITYCLSTLQPDLVLGSF